MNSIPPETPAPRGAPTPTQPEGSGEFAAFLARHPLPASELEARLAPFARRYGARVELVAGGGAAFASFTPPLRVGEVWTLAKGNPLTGQGSWIGGSASAAVTAAYATAGDHGVATLDGQFAAVIFDHGNLRLFRDSFGFGSLYVWERSDGWVVLSVLDGLRAFPEWKARVSALGVEAFFAYDRLPAELTLFEDVRRVPLAHGLSLPSGQCQCLRELAVHEEPNIRESEALDYVWTRLGDRLSGLPSGDAELLFSGGLDSSLLLALVAERKLGLRLHTLVYPGKRRVGLDTVKPMADHFGWPVHLTEMSADLSGALDLLVSALQEPDADMGLLGFRWLFSASPCRYGAMGMVADTIIPNFKAVRRRAWLRKWSWIPGCVLRGWRALRRGASLEGDLPAEEILPVFISDAQRRSARRRLAMLHRTSKAQSQQVDGIPGHVLRYLPADAEPLQRYQMLFLDAHYGLRNRAFADIAAAEGHCCVCPFEDLGLLNQVLRLPRSLTYDHPEGKYLLRELARRRLPAQHIHSQPLSLPISTYFRVHMESIRKELLDPDAPLAAWVRLDRVERWLRRLEHGGARAERKLSRETYTLLLLSRWLKRWV